ncbi:aldolase/citrate lyase/malate synthase family protein [Marinoscillum furvescens]|uniref:malate synthase n=1 Tax=Marinoscillum furvescens DSM 4134 TaxID=1122208 RepID=A0A3D9LH32_MARFU|nr:hypothetical protein [Marinoscillum furvescens]REE05918.1 malate synthase [Marinoscillum furvescens DSM 4134]
MLSTLETPIGLELNEAVDTSHSQLLNAQALDFLLALHERFNEPRKELLKYRQLTEKLVDTTSQRPIICQPEQETPHQGLPLPQLTQAVPAEALTKEAQNGHQLVNFNDCASSVEVIEAQEHLTNAIENRDAQEEYQVIFAPRALDFEDRLFMIHDRPGSASLIDFGLFFFHNAHELLRQSFSPTIYLTEVNSVKEAHWWNEVFAFAQSYLGLSNGTLRVIVETSSLWSAIELPKIAEKLSNHLGAIASTPMDYLANFLCKFEEEEHLPNRDQLTLNCPMFTALNDLVVQVAHRHGVPALYNSRGEFTREIDLRLECGFDGEIVASATEAEAVLASYPKECVFNKRYDVTVTTDQLAKTPLGTITMDGVKACYEQAKDGDELARTMLTSWVNCGCKTVSGLTITDELIKDL